MTKLELELSLLNVPNDAEIQLYDIAEDSYYQVKTAYVDNVYRYGYATREVVVIKFSSKEG